MSRSKSRRPRATNRMHSRVSRRSRPAPRHLRARSRRYEPFLSIRPLSLAPTLDRRTWWPDRERRLTVQVDPPRRSTSPDRLNESAFDDLSRSFTRAQPAFDDARRVSVCVRREERRRVVFAKKLFGRGGKGKRNALSAISCRRKR